MFGSISFCISSYVQQSASCNCCFVVVVVVVVVCAVPQSVAPPRPSEVTLEPYSQPHPRSIPHRQPTGPQEETPNAW